MRLDPAIVAELALPYEFENFIRVMPAAHKAAPLGTGFGTSRFSSRQQAFRLLYAAPDLRTALAEALIRDRFEGKAKRVLDMTEIEERVVAEISTRHPLKLLDLRKDGLLKLGVSTDAARAKSHHHGQKLSDAVHAGFDMDGILYLSRLTSEECVAVYDRAIDGKLKAGKAIALERAPGLVSDLSALSVSVRLDQ